MRGNHVSHRLFITRELGERLSDFVNNSGVMKSSIPTEAPQAWLSRKGISGLEQRLGMRLGVMRGVPARLEHDSQVEIEIAALLGRDLLASRLRAAESDDVARAAGRERIQWITMKVAGSIPAGCGRLGSRSGS